MSSNHNKPNQYQQPSYGNHIQPQQYGQTQQTQNCQGLIYDPRQDPEMIKRHFNKMVDYNYRVGEMYHKSDINMNEFSNNKSAMLDYLEKKEDLKLKRTLMTHHLFLNSEGFICREIIDADGKSINSTKVCNKPNVELAEFVVSENNKEICYYGLSVGRGEKLFWLKESEMVPEMIGRKLAKAGVSIITANEHRKSMLYSVFAFLMEHKLVIPVTSTHGWCKEAGMWQWIEKETTTREELEYYVNK